MHTDFPKLSTKSDSPSAPSQAELIPLTGNAGKTPVLLLDGSCSYADLQDCADLRLIAARGLLRSLVSLESSEACGSDLLHFAHAAELLLTDACDLLAAARKSVRREAVG